MAAGGHPLRFVVGLVAAYRDSMNVYLLVEVTGLLQSSRVSATINRDLR